MDSLLLIALTFHLPLAMMFMVYGWLSRPVRCHEWEIWCDTGLQQYYCTMLKRQLDRVRGHHSKLDRVIELNPEYMLLTAAASEENHNDTSVCIRYINCHKPLTQWLKDNKLEQKCDTTFVKMLEAELAEHFLTVR